MHILKNSQRSDEKRRGSTCKESGIQKIVEIFNAHKGKYAYHRILIICSKGYTINHKTIQKIMKILSLKSKKKYIYYRNDERIFLKLKEMSPEQYRAHSLII